MTAVAPGIVVYDLMCGMGELPRASGHEVEYRDLFFGCAPALVRQTAAWRWIDKGDATRS